MAEKKLLNYGAMSRQLGVAERTLRDWVFKHKVPSLKVGHRTTLFCPDEVWQSLQAFKVAASTAKKGRVR